MELDISRSKIIAFSRITLILFKLTTAISMSLMWNAVLNGFINTINRMELFPA